MKSDLCVLMTISAKRGDLFKVMWVRQRARIAERIEATRREYAADLPEQTAGH